MSAQQALIDNPAVKEVLAAIFLDDDKMCNVATSRIKSLQPTANVGRAIACLHAMHAATLMINSWYQNEENEESVVFTGLALSRKIGHDLMSEMAVNSVKFPHSVFNKLEEAFVAYNQAKDFPRALEKQVVKRKYDSEDSSIMKRVWRQHSDASASNKKDK